MCRRPVDSGGIVSLEKARAVDRLGVKLLEDFMADSSDADG
jgi:hypothetical protein